MILTLTCNIKRLSKTEYSMLREMCKASNSLYNVALYNIRQYFFETKEYLSFKENYHLCKKNENYKMLQAGVAQQTLRCVDKSFRSFFALLRSKRNGDCSFRVRIPGYQKKGSMFPLIMQKNALSIRNGHLRIPVSRAFKERYGNVDIRIPFPKKLNGKEIREVRIVPSFTERHFTVQYIYEEEATDLCLDKTKALAIDTGVTNLATCITSTGTSMIIDGRKLKSINRYWNKEVARLKSVAKRQGVDTTKRIEDITIKRNNRCDDYLKKAARIIINYCIKSGIGVVVCGYISYIKDGCNIGHVNNQNFVSISYSKLRSQLRTLCERYGMQYVETSEHNTSLASFLDKDDIPEGKVCKDTFSGRRIKRRVYRTKDGVLLNADVNAAANILKKSSVVSICALYGRGGLGTPVRIRVA